MIRCLFKRSDMTPCVIEDGAMCYSGDGGPVDEGHQPVCVGCERDVAAITYDLEARGHEPILPVPPGQSGGRRH